MSTPHAPDTPARRFARFLPSGRAWWLVAGAFAAGLLLFALVLSGKRGEFDFYRAERDRAATVEDQVFDPLPEPLPAGGDSASGLDDTAPRDAGPRIDQHAAAPGEASPQAPAEATAATVATGMAQDASVPRAVSAPAPDYPRSALRSRASGEVVLSIEVREDGRPGKVEIADSSRSRDLDRAAVQAVRRWRFQPAMRDGIAVAATVRQAIRFDAPE